MKQKILFLAVLVCFGLAIISVGTVVTDSATVNTSWMSAQSEICVKMTGHATGASDSVWFIYGNNESGYYSFRTKNTTTSGSYTSTVCGFPWLPGETYDIKAASLNGTGSVVTVVIPTITPHQTTTYEQLVDEFIESGDDPKAMITLVWEPYTGVMGGIFFGLLTIGIFINIAIKQKTVFLSLLLSILCGGTLWGLFLDEPAIVEFAQILITAGCVGMFYFLISKPR